MTLRASLLAVAASGALLAGAGAAAAQELQAGQMMTQAEADRLEALQADLDRKEAEDADTERRDRTRRPHHNQSDLEAADELASEMDAEANRRDILQRQRNAIYGAADLVEATPPPQPAERDEGDARTTCLARLPASQKEQVEAVLQQYRLMERQLRQEGNMPNLAEAIAGLHRGRDMAIDSITSNACA